MKHSFCPSMYYRITEFVAIKFYGRMFKYLKGKSHNTNLEL